MESGAATPELTEKTGILGQIVAHDLQNRKKEGVVGSNPIASWANSHFESPTANFHGLVDLEAAGR